MSCMVNGILLFDKPQGMTSNAALQKVKRLFNAKKAGHTGSLDPLATGMLPICFGEATKFSQFLLEADKTYAVGGKLGIKTTTGDSDGAVISTRIVENITEEKIKEVMRQLIGPLQQVPPMYSALKYQGKALYQLAREGVTIPREPRNIMIHALNFHALKKDVFHFEVQCSKGTYVRSLVEEIGERLQCDAHVSALRRLAVVPYEERPMYTLEELEIIFKEQGYSGLYALLLPMETAVAVLPEVMLSADEVFYLRRGQKVKREALASADLIRLFTAEREFIGIGRIAEEYLYPHRLVAVIS